MTTAARISLARTLYTAADRFETDYARYGGRWASSSPAAQEMRDERYPGAWSDTPVQDAHLSVMLHLHAAAEHLRVLGTALEHSNSVIPLFTLARGVLDQSCGPWYRLAPDIGDAARVKRFMNSQLGSSQEQLNLLNVIQVPSPEVATAQVEALDRIQAITGTAEQYDWRVVPASGWKPPHIHTGEGNGKPPSTTALAEKILPAGSIGLLSWRLNSGFAHGESYALASLLKKDESGRGPVEQTDQQAALRYAFAPLAFAELMRRAYVRFGWDRTDLRRESQDARDVWTTTAGVTPAAPVPATFLP